MSQVFSPSLDRHGPVIIQFHKGNVIPKQLINAAVRKAINVHTQCTCDKSPNAVCPVHGYYPKAV